MLVTAAEFTPMLWYISEWNGFWTWKKKLGFYPLGVDMNMKVCIACDFCYPSSNMYNFEQVLNLLSWLCLFLFFSRVLLLGGRGIREAWWVRGWEKGIKDRGKKVWVVKSRWVALLSLFHLFPRHSISLSSLRLRLPILLLIWLLHLIWKPMESFSTNWRWGKFKYYQNVYLFV